LGWCYDYPDTNNFLYDVFYSVGPDSNNNTNWENDDFKALLDEAAVMTDNDARRELYAQAEYLLVNQDAAIAPIYYYTSQQMTKPYVERSFALDKHERLETWDIMPQ
jgi:oligopeptide transport system substrate-binding protein